MWLKTICRQCGNSRRVVSFTPDGQYSEKPCPVCRPVGCEDCASRGFTQTYIFGVLTNITCARCGGSRQQPHDTGAPFWVEPNKPLANPVISRGEPVPSWMTPSPDRCRRKP